MCCIVIFGIRWEVRAPGYHRTLNREWLGSLQPVRPAVSRKSNSDIKVFYLEGVFLDKVAAWLYLFSHQDYEHMLRFN